MGFTFAVIATLMDRWGDHALVRACGVDRTKHHNIIRNVGGCLAASAGWRPEKEKAGLLRATIGGNDTRPGYTVLGGSPESVRIVILIFS